MNNDWMNGMSSKAGCHTGNPVVFTIDDVTILAGGHSRDGGWHRMSPLPDLALGPAQVMDRAQATVVPDGFTCQGHIGGSAKMISIDWPDFSIPQDVGREFWLALVDDIKRLGIKTISTQCVGGHGRTGVQLAILGYLMGAIPSPHDNDAGSIIKHVRDIYCHHAVETGKQQEYVAMCCGIAVGENLFPVLAKKKNNFTFKDESDYPTKHMKSKTPSKYWYTEEELDDIVDDFDGDGFPTSWELYACGICNHSTWTHTTDPTPTICDGCAGDEMMLATQGLYDMSGICPKCDNTVSPFGMHSDVCIPCAIEEEGKATVSDGEVKCKGCRKMRLPEFIQLDSLKCHDCERKVTMKKDAQTKRAKGKGKGKDKAKDKAKNGKGKGKGRDKYAPQTKNMLKDW